MLSSYFTLSPKVEQEGSFYVVTGINTKSLEQDLKNNFGTSVIFNRLITRINARSFKIHKFFMVELAWILDHLTNQKNKRTVDRYYVGLFRYKQLYDEVKTKTWLETTYQTFPSYPVDEALKEFTITPYPDQRDFLEEYSRIKYGFQLKGCLLDAVVGSGKANPLSTKIKIPGGWTTMGKIKVGDVITGADGLPTTVLAVFPQGEQDIYKFTFHDGRVAEATLDHVWTVWQESHSGGYWKTMTTKEIIEKREISPHFKNQTHIPLIKPELVEDKKYVIDPYAMGALLGDGGFTGGGISFTNSDEFVVNKLRERLGDHYLVKEKSGYRKYSYRVTTQPFRASLQSVLKELELINKLSVEKHIPEEYMNGSVEQRWELLRGLMDTDGSADLSPNKKGPREEANATPVFSTSSATLAKQVQELVWSLGGVAKCTSRIPKFTYKGEKKEGLRAYRVWIRIPNPKRCFSLPKKMDRVPEENQYSKQLKARIVNIEFSHREEAQCIAIDNESKLYVINDYVVTHNTPTSLIWSKMISKGKLFIVVPKGLVYSPWVNEINKVYKKPPKVWTSLDGTNILNHVDAEIFIIHKEPIRTESWELAIKTITKNGQLPAKVIVDECHNYNEHSSQQTKGLIDFCSHPYISDVLFMSGTPIKAQGKETYALFTIIDKFFDKNVRDNFLKMYGRDNTFLNEMLAHRLGRIKYTIPAITTMEAPPEPEVIKVSFPGAEAFTLNNIRTDMLTYITERVKFYKERMSTYKEDWLIYVNDFKERKWSDQSIQARVKTYVDYVNYFQTNGYNNFTDSDKSKFCANVEKEIESYLKGEDLHYFRHIKSAVKYVGLKIRGEALGNVLGKARMNAIKETIRHANLPKLIDSVKKKTLVYTSYVEVIKELEDYFKEVGLKSVSVYGNNSTEIDKVISQLADDPDTNPLITTFQTLREGKPMLMANQIILMNSPFRSYELTQTIARVHRRGQDEKCYVYLIDLDTGEEENITSRSIDILEWSREQVEQLLGGGKLPGVNELGVNTTAIGGFEQMCYIWDIPNVLGELNVCLDIVEHNPKILPRTSIGDIF